MPSYSWLSLIITGLFIGSCSEEKMPNSTDIWPNGTTYEIFVQSFADSNGDGIGDIPGMTSKLDYLADLGIQAIWLMPIHPSPSYHKYDVTDYYAIHPDYGTLEDFRSFVEEAHQRKIKVIMDLVVNHTSWDHPWFMESKRGKENPFRNYYVWEDIEVIKDQIAKKEVTLDSDNLTQWHRSEGNEEYYYGFFYKGMPDLNFDNREVREEILRLGKYWIDEFSVDGYRLDAAGHVFPDERAIDSHLWWQEFGAAMRRQNPNIYLVGEVWGASEEIAPYMKGLRSMFNFNFYHALNRSIVKETNTGLIDSLIVSYEMYKDVEREFCDAIFVNNHDRTRLIDDVEGNVQKSQLATAIILTLPGMPYIYYGDEIAMRGKKPDEYIREPFLWEQKGLAPEQTSWIEPVNSTYETVKPLSEQRNDPLSTYSVYKHWIGLRNQNSILRTGALESLSLPSYFVGYKRFSKEKSLVIIHNISNQNQTLNLENITHKGTISSFNNRVMLQNNILELPPYSSVVLE